MDAHRTPIANVSRVLYVAMAISAVVSIAVYVLLAKLLFDLVRSTDIDGVGDMLWLLTTVLSVPLTIGAILYTILQARRSAAVGGLVAAFAGFAWNISFGEREIALLLLAPTAMVLLIGIWLVVRTPDAHGAHALSPPESRYGETHGSTPSG